ncbi:hypothetical protein KC19_9G021000 [Ceratodon purpureus]|uniref:Peptidase A1 domain-containing protein n=1 Tax=Ceratodon purpureus TaxID=3225 RepID=A0A8T0GVD7_CERPU|nr:hypothetical protein KC19_9G021000 [Ceratodon purpureus]
MRRGGRGRSLQALWRGCDDAIPSALHLERGWAKLGNYAKVVVLVACSIVTSIIIWSLQPGRPPGSHYNLGSRNPGIVFPLYQNYQQYANGSHAVGGRERRQGRNIRSDELNPMFKLRLGHRSWDDHNTEFYIEMKVGDPPKPYYFHIDTGSGSPWVYCAIPEYESTLADFGPNGRFVSKENSVVKCTGPTASLCRALQSKVACNEEDNYECMFSALYGDDSYYEGVVVNETLTIPMQDMTERTVFVLIGCVLDKEDRSEELPLLTDGVVGLGKCEGSLVDQLSTSKAIIQKVLGVCLAKEIRGTMIRSPGQVGYISLGMDFGEKFDQSKSVWAKLVGPKMDCEYVAKLLFISIGNIRIPVGNAGMALGFDTGSDLAFLRKDVYDQVLDALDSFTWNGDYFRVRDDENYVLSEQRLCWHFRGKKRKRG